MKKFAIIIASLLIALPALAQSQAGQAFIHDPSTIALSNGKYFTFGTGGGGMISNDGYHWYRGPQEIQPHRCAAPDIIKIGDRYLVVHGASGGGLGGRHKASIYTKWTKSLDPESPDFGYTEPVEVAWSGDDEDCDAIDPSFLLDPTTGRLWLTYGTYFGFIRLVALDPKTGARVPGNEPLNIAIDCEATDLIYRNGWYYLLGTHGTCCDGANSTYNIVCGRSREVTGPYLDNMGRDMIKGGGKMVLNAWGRVQGPGHFGRYIEDCGVEKMSCHFEADLDLGGFSTLCILPLRWVNDWPVAGEPTPVGSMEIESVRRGYSLELAVDFTRIERRMRWFGMNEDTKIEPLPSQKLEDVIGTWPAGEIGVRCGDYISRPHQRWTITPLPDQDGFLGGAYCKITIEGTNRALAATADAELIAVPEFTGAPEQLWRIEQCIDGTWRISPKAVPGHEGEKLYLVSVADSTPALGAWDFNSDNSKWIFRDIR